MAAIELLISAGTAYRSGYSSENISRDGVSESQTYTASATYGIYSAHIDEYKEWLYGKNSGDKGNLKKIKDKFLGIPMVTI